MMNRTALVPPNRLPRRRELAITVTLAAGFAAAATCGHRQPTLASACRAASEGSQPQTAALCLASFVLTNDPATGALAARALEAQGGAEDIIERLAAAIGDSNAGADAWLAAGNARKAHDPARAVIAYRRALDHRAPDNVSGRIRDTIGLLLAFAEQGDYQNATQKAADAYELASRATSDQDRGLALLDIALLLIEIGDLETTARLVDEAEHVVAPASAFYPYLRQLHGLIEQRRGHPALARQALREARSDALQRHNEALGWDVYVNLLDLALEQGDVREARALLTGGPAVPDRAADRAARAYYQARLLVQDGKFAAAVQVAGEALGRDPAEWVQQLEAIRGAALRRSGRPGEAEQALLRAIGALEDQRETINDATVKSWLMAQRRAPFEELFVLYLEQGRPLDALAVVQRAIARSVVDELLRGRPSPGAVPGEIISAGARLTAARTLSRSLRASPGTAAPPIDTVVARLRGRHVVTYFRADRELWALAITRDSELVARRIGDVTQIARLVSRWLARPGDAELAAQLGEQLLPQPLVPPAGETLFVVLDDALRDVAFAALRWRGAYLVERNPVAYGLSAASLAIERAPRRGASPVVIGDPTNDLPDARREAIEVGEALEVAPYLGAAATRAVVLGAANASVLHIAAHTGASANGPAIHLAGAAIDATAILAQPIAPPLVVVLGCGSARIEDRDELGPLASAFIAAGADAVVASRWTVDDAIARRFARAFYAAGGARDPIAALAAAQRRLQSEGVPAGQWATFVVVGGLRAKP